MAHQIGFRSVPQNGPHGIAIYIAVQQHHLLPSRLPRAAPGTDPVSLRNAILDGLESPRASHESRG